METKKLRKKLLNLDEQILDLHSLISELLYDVVEPDLRSPALRAADLPEQKCPSCAGSGFWSETVVTKSVCEECNGTGKPFGRQLTLTPLD